MDKASEAGEFGREIFYGGIQYNPSNDCRSETKYFEEEFEQEQTYALHIRSQKKVELQIPENEIIFARYRGSNQFDWYQHHSIELNKIDILQRSYKK